MVAWGWNTLGQLNGPALPAGVSYTAVAAGHEHSLALTNTLPKQGQTISFTSAPPTSALLGGGDDGGAAATSGLPVALSSSTPSVCTVSGGIVSFNAVGTCTITANQAGDNGYNAAPEVTQGFAVVYAFSGFFQPVDNLPTLNVVKAGAGVAVKFSLGGNQGLAVLASGSPSSAVVPCDSSVPLDDIEQAVTTSGSGLSYDATSNQYAYVWRTDKAWAGQCRQLVVKLADGTEHRANFRFR